MVFVTDGFSFQDAPTNNTFYNYIEHLYCVGAISGYPCGGPGEPCTAPNNRPYFRVGNNATRGQFTKILSSALGWSDPPSGQTFEDVQATGPTSTFYVFIQRAASRGLIGGTLWYKSERAVRRARNRPYFRPNNNITRAQISKVVVLGRGWVTGTPTPVPTTAPYTFQDVPPTNAFQFADVERVQRQQIARLVRLYVADRLGRPLGEHARRPALPCSSTASRAARVPSCRRRNSRQIVTGAMRDALAGELIAVPLRPARRPRQREGDHAALRLHRDGRRATRRACRRFGCTPSGPYCSNRCRRPIEHRPRHPMPAARFTDIAQPLGVAQHAQPLTVYAVLEGHRSTPFHVSRQEKLVEG